MWGMINLSCQVGSIQLTLYVYYQLEADGPMLMLSSLFQAYNYHGENLLAEDKCGEAIRCLQESVACKFFNTLVLEKSSKVVCIYDNFVDHIQTLYYTSFKSVLIWF